MKARLNLGDCRARRPYLKVTPVCLWNAGLAGRGGPLPRSICGFASRISGLA